MWDSKKLPRLWDNSREKLYKDTFEDVLRNLIKTFEL